MKLNNESAFTLVEVIVASVLFLMVGAMALTTLSTSRRWMEPRYNRAAQTHLARVTAENLYEASRAMWWNDATQNWTRLRPTGGQVVVNGIETVDGETYSRRISINDAPDPLGTQNKYRKAVIVVRKCDDPNAGGPCP